MGIESTKLNVKSKPWEMMEGESSKAFNAFSMYLQMNPDIRSMQSVADTLKVSLQAISRWSRPFNWVERTAAYDQYAFKKQLKHREKNREQQIYEMEKLHAEVAQDIITSLHIPFKILAEKLSDENERELFIHKFKNMDPDELMNLIKGIPNSIAGTSKMHRLALGVTTDITQSTINQNTTLTIANEVELNALMQDEKAREAIEYLARFTVGIKNDDAHEEIRFCIPEEKQDESNIAQA